MKSTGIVRSVDSLGRFVLPKELRDSFGITTDTPIEIFTDGNTSCCAVPRRRLL